MSEKLDHHKFILLGASRGLGWATFAQLAKKYPQSHFLLISRKIADCKTTHANTKLFAADFSQATLSDELVKVIQDFNPTHILYIAGGGPYGEFQAKKWSDHVWALNVNFNTPAQILHFVMQEIQNSKSFSNLKSCVFVGSSIAENKPDAMASSYCAAKHALKGLVTTIQQENAIPQLNVKLFSPGYIETGLLPQNSWPRRQGLTQSAEIVASDLINYVD